MTTKIKIVIQHLYKNLIINMIPGTEILTNVQIDPNFMYDKEHLFLIPYSDYVEYFI